MALAEVNGLDALDARLAAFPAQVSAELMAKANALAGALADKVRDEKLSGGVLAQRSGALAQSIAGFVTSDGDDVVATVGSFGDVKYAAIQEYGGKTAAHEIVAKNGKALAFAVGGAMRFARHVNHPGSQIPERSYLRSSLEEMQDAIVAALADAVSQAWGRA